MRLPTSEHDVYLWSTVLAGAYAALAAALRAYVNTANGSRKFHTASGIELLFNGLTFAGSVLLLLGIYDDAVMKAIGNTTGYLGFAGLVGFGYSVRAVWPKRHDE